MTCMTKQKPMLSRQLAGGVTLDLLKQKNLSHGVGTLWSTDRWAITGEAGLFADPLYSPGTDFIGLSNTFVADLITRDCSAPELGIRVAVYEKMYRSFYESTMTLYEGQYAGFGDSRLMAVKLTWDYAYYWSILAWLFFRDVLTDLNFLRAIQPDIEQIRTLNNKVQAAFRERASKAIVEEGKGRFFDQIAVPSIVELNASLLNPSDDLVSELRQNCARLEALAPKLLDVLAGIQIGKCPLLGDLEQRIEATERDNQFPA